MQKTAQQIAEEQILEFITEQQKKGVPKKSDIAHPEDWEGEDHPRNVTLDRNIAPAEFTKSVEVGAGKRRKLTQKQILMSKYMLTGDSHRKAMLKAGYAISSSNSLSVKSQATVLNFMEGINRKFLARGISEEYIADKMKAWFEAKKKISTRDGLVEEEDYKTQLAAYDKWREATKPKEEAPQQKKREITLTEYIMGGSEPE